MIENLKLRNFRNYSDLEVSFDPNVNILLGVNGQGKTNLIESISLLISGESFRYGENTNLIRKGEELALIRARFKNKDLIDDLRLEITKSRKNHFLNEKRVSATDLLMKSQFVLFSPESLGSIKEGADHRRQLIDELLMSVQRSNALLIRDFRKALKVRNRILKNGLEGLVSRQETLDLLESLNPSYFRLSSLLSFARLQALQEIQPHLNIAMCQITGSNLLVEARYLISGVNALHFSHGDIHNFLQKRALELRDAELSSGTSLVGPHKHDIVFLYDENDSRFFCSQGQQRALILSFKMAQIVYHRRAHGAHPILLLDDVLSELDEQKREALIRFLQEIRTQIFMSTTDLKMTGDLASHDCRVIEIFDGQVR